MPKLITSLFLLFLTFNSAYSQGVNDDFLRSTGKIYTVVGGILIIFLCIAVYLWRIDNKLTKLEKHIKDGQ